MRFAEKIVIRPVSENDRLKTEDIRISRTLYKIWRLDEHSPLTIICGSQTRVVHCLPMDDDDTGYQVECARMLLTMLHLPPEPLPLQLSFNPTSGELKIGPIVAILAVTKNNHPENPLGRLITFCKEIARYSEKQHILFYVFSLKDWRSDCVTGLIWQHNHWERRMLPHPHVIHNRIHSRTLEQSHPTQIFFRSLQEKNVPYFNERFLDKWEVYEMLFKRKELLPYLPETKLFEEKETIKTMLSSSRSLFVKPVHGSLGKQIIRIQQQDNGFDIDFTSFDGLFERHYESLDRLWDVLSKLIQTKHFIVQTGLLLMTYNQSPLDFRILCGKDRTGNWKITSSTARVSREDQFVSNVSQGGELHAVDDVLHESFPPAFAKQMKRLIGELAHEIVTIIEAETEGFYGELGVDLGIDEHGHPWIIEVNTKPSKHLDPERDQTTIRPSAKAVIDYSHYLSGFHEDE
jgi:glutathione synthase/RimK-type ligase-like ATP-grasp enzyme